MGLLTRCGGRHQCRRPQGGNAEDRRSQSDNPEEWARSQGAQSGNDAGNLSSTICESAMSRKVIGVNCQVSGKKLGKKYYSLFPIPYP